MLIAAFAAHVLVSAAAGLVATKLFKDHIPAPYNRASFMVPAIIAIGILVTLLTLPHWQPLR